MGRQRTGTVMDHGVDWAQSARRGEVSPGVLAFIAVATIAVLWVAVRVLRFVMKAASVVTMLSAVAGVLVYLFNRDREDYLDDDE